MKTKIKTIIYCRVSSKAQMIKGHGLASQETRCREYCRRLNYDVQAVFLDKAISGKSLQRPKIREMLDYLKKHAKAEPYVVVIDDISRLARNVETHHALRRAISCAGGKLESPSIEFGDDSDSRLRENLLASVAAHGREKNAEQVKNRMQSRMQNGYWVFHQPIGYKFVARAGRGKVLVLDEPVASVVRQALEGFASGRFGSLTEVSNFMASHRHFPPEEYGCLHLTRMREMMERMLYTGYVEYHPWGIQMRPGQHDALISMQTYNKIQERLKAKSNAPNRKDIHLDFPLRGFVLCDTCEHPMTACWSAGRTAKYAYYLCRNKECPECKKSVKREVMEEHFGEVLDAMTPAPKLVAMVRDLVHKAWKDSTDSHGHFAKALHERIQALEGEIEMFLQRILDTDSTTVIKAYEAKIGKLETEKAELAERLLDMDQVPADFDSTFQTAFDFLANPQKLWASEDIEDKKLLLRLGFSRQLPYRRNEGFQTVDFSLPFAVSRGLAGPKSGMVVETVSIKPVSASNSLICRENTGNLRSVGNYYRVPSL